MARSILLITGVILFASLIALSVSRLTTTGPVAPTVPQGKPQAQVVEGPSCDKTLTVLPAPDCVEVTKTAAPSCSTVHVTLNVNTTCPSSVVKSENDIVIVLDTSSSMNDLGGNPVQPITDAKNAAITFLDSIDGTYNKVGFVTYSSTAQVRNNLTYDYAAIENSINAASLSEGTNIADAMDTAESLLANSLASGRNPFIVIFTDGVPTRTLEGTTCDADPTAVNACMTQAIAEATAAKQAGTTVYSILLQNENNNTTYSLAKQTMQAVATEGNFYEAQDSGQLAGIFSNIAQTIENILATNITVTEILPPGVTYVPGSFSIDPTNINGQEIIWNLGSLSAGQNATITFDVTLSSLETQLVEVYPDSGVTYEDQFGNSKTEPFPETYVTPQLCTPTPSQTPTATPTNTPSPTNTPTNTPTPTRTPTPTQTPTPTPTPTNTPTNTPSHTVNPTITPTLTLTPSNTPTPTPTPAPMCVAIRIYDENGNLITDYSTLSPGDSIIIMVVGTNYSSARIKINNEANWRVSSTLYTANDGVSGIRFDYTFPADILTYTIQAQVSYDGVTWQ